MTQSKTESNESSFTVSSDGAGRTGPTTAPATISPSALIECSPADLKGYTRVDSVVGKFRYSFYYPAKTCSNNGKFMIYSQPLKASDKTACKSYRIYESSKYNELYGTPVVLGSSTVSYLFFSPVLNACGSGFDGELKVLISKNNEDIVIRSLSRYDELSQYFKLNDRCLIFVSSIWDKDEAHFDLHTLKVYAYKVDDKGNVEKKYLGKTLDKYSVVDTAPVSSYLLKEEPWIQDALSEFGCLVVD